MIWIKFIKILKKSNPNKKRKILIVFDDMIANKRNPIVAELFIRGNIKHFHCFYYTIVFCCTQKISDWVIHTILLWKFQINDSFNKSHIIIHKIFILETLCIFTKNIVQNHIFLAIDATLAWDNSLRLRKSILERI